MPTHRFTDGAAVGRHMFKILPPARELKQLRSLKNGDEVVFVRSARPLPNLFWESINAIGVCAVLLS
jgi:hypothetical protein